MTWNGEWKPTLPLTRHEVNTLQNFGIVELTIDGVKVLCNIGARRGYTYARSIKSGQWFQLCP